MKKNIDLENQIRLKNSHLPYHGTIDDLKISRTGMEHFPYTGFYRGVYNRQCNNVYNRKVGWNPRCQKKMLKKDLKLLKPNVCFQYPCDVILPCHYEECLTLYR